MEYNRVYHFKILEDNFYYCGKQSYINGVQKKSDYELSIDIEFLVLPFILKGSTPKIFVYNLTKTLYYKTIRYVAKCTETFWNVLNEVNFLKLIELSPKTYFFHNIPKLIQELQRIFRIWPVWNFWCHENTHVYYHKPFN